MVRVMTDRSIGNRDREQTVVLGGRQGTEREAGHQSCQDSGVEIAAAMSEHVGLILCPFLMGKDEGGTFGASFGSA